MSRSLSDISLKWLRRTFPMNKVTGRSPARSANQAMPATLAYPTATNNSPRGLARRKSSMSEDAERLSEPGPLTTLETSQRVHKPSVVSPGSGAVSEVDSRRRWYWGEQAVDPLAGGACQGCSSPQRRPIRFGPWDSEGDQNPIWADRPPGTSEDVHPRSPRWALRRRRCPLRRRVQQQPVRIRQIGVSRYRPDRDLLRLHQPDVSASTGDTTAVSLSES